MKFSQFTCTLDSLTGTLVVNYVNTSFTNMSFTMNTNDPFLTDLSAINRENTTNLTYLNEINLKIGTVNANYVFNFSNLYCNLLSYDSLVTSADQFVSINKYQCGNAIIGTTNDNIATSPTSARFTFSY